MRFSIDPTLSLAWYQINPHLNHLWATTCPEEPSWRPGEGHSSGWLSGNFSASKQGNAAVDDTTEVPLYPRYEALPLCTEAVTGQIIVTDTAQWRGVRGEVVVQAEKLYGGEKRRDDFTRDDVLEVTRYPEIRFTIDSLTNLRREADTLVGLAVGVLTLHGKSKPMTAGIRAWPEAGGLRVTGKLRLDANAMTKEFGLSKFALGLGVLTGLWHHLFVGVDVILRAEPFAG